MMIQVCVWKEGLCLEDRVSEQGGSEVCLTIVCALTIACAFEERALYKQKPAVQTPGVPFNLPTHACTHLSGSVQRTYMHMVPICTHLSGSVQRTYMHMVPTCTQQRSLQACAAWPNVASLQGLPCEHTPPSADTLMHFLDISPEAIQIQVGAAAEPFL
jgi:hypothetical protein